MLSKRKPNALTAARLAAVQALYQMETAGAGAENVIREFSEHGFGADLGGGGAEQPNAQLFTVLVRGVVTRQRKLDPFIEQFLSENWRLSRIDATARAILRAASYELLDRPAVPYRVVINEYVDIARSFFGGDEPKFINAVLDAAAHAARRDEVEEGEAGRL